MQFDEYADDYERALAEGLAVSGEGRDYFARGRVAWLAGLLAKRRFAPSSVLDFGCGTGSGIPLLRELTGGGDVIGLDRSSRSLAVAAREHAHERTRFLLFEEYRPSGAVDLAFSNGVFHHIPPAERPAVLDYVLRALRPGGLLALWENNPWNPGTRYVMSRIPFDRDAVPISPPEARALLREAGFEVLRIDFLFIFPRPLRWLRALEPPLCRLPFGAQYQVLARKPRETGVTLGTGADDTADSPAERNR
ncbi:MAG: class I SAM-dependent methyltransferase [Candidatus Binatia bacterium]